MILVQVPLQQSWFFVQPSAYGVDNACLFDAMEKRHDTTRAIVVIDPRKEHIAILEARKLGVPVVAIVDTTRPDVIHCSAARREATPPRARIF